MRPNHQNKRMRGRSRGGSGGGGGGNKGPNPLTRSYESNGPDVKIRGTAQHIAEKYLQMGRDAQATGDYVAAENYFQHAEHYLRIIATAHEAMRLANPQFKPYEAQDSEDGEDDEDGVPFASGTPQPEIRYSNIVQADAEQPELHTQPREFQQQDRGPRQDRRPERRDNRREQPHREFQPREPRGDAPQDQAAPRDMSPREFAPREGGRFDRRERFERRHAPSERGTSAHDADVQPGLPAFITAPTRPVADEQPPVVAPPSSLFPATEGTTEFPVNERRGRGRPRKVPANPNLIDEAGE